MIIGLFPTFPLLATGILVLISFSDIDVFVLPRQVLYRRNLLIPQNECHMFCFINIFFNS